MRENEGGEVSVGVAVLNQPVPDPRSRSDVRRGYLRMADMVVGIRNGLPGLDLIAFPEFGTHGFPPGGGSPAVGGAAEVLTFPGEEIEILARACRTAGVWGVFSVSGGRARPDDWHRIVLIDRDGRVVVEHRRRRDGIGPVPDTQVVAGPKGLRIGLSLGGPTSARSCARHGAELVVHCEMHPDVGPGEVVAAARCRAWSGTCYVAGVNAVGCDGSHTWTGHSTIVGYDGRVLGQCGGEEYELQYAELWPGPLRRTRSDHARLERSLRHRAGARPGTAVALPA